MAAKAKTSKGTKTAKPGEREAVDCPSTAKRPTGEYVTNWPSFFEIDGGGYRRKGGLEYVRYFVSAGGTKSTESSQFLQLLNVLRAISPERYHHNLGIYFGLVALTATLQRCYRGWLLDEGLKPLTERGMARRLFVELAVMRQAIKDLLAAGLLQRRPLPDFDPSADDDEDEQRTEARERKSGRGKAAKKPGKQGRSGRVCKHLQEFAKGAEPFVRKSEVTNDLKQERNTTGQLAKGERQSQGQGQGPPATPTATPPEGQGPLKPQGVTGQGGRHYSPSGHREPAITRPARASSEPQIVRLPRGGEPVRAGQLLPRVMDALSGKGFGVRAPEFGMAIYEALRCPFPPESRERARELANYEHALLDAVDAGLTARSMQELWDKALQDAQKIGRNRKRFYRDGGSPEQFWRFKFGKHLAARVPPARAGPDAAAI